MKLLIVPESNSQSHLAKALALKETAESAGHSVVLGVNRSHGRILAGRGVPHSILPSPVDTDGSGYPSEDWYWDIGFLGRIIDAEVDLIRSAGADRVIGVFRSTLATSAEIAGVPCDSVICGCMLHRFPEAMGFFGTEPVAEEQKKLMDNYFRWAARKLSRVRSASGLEPVADLRTQYEGERTWLWDYPEFCPLPDSSGLEYIGPPDYRGWEFGRPCGDIRQWKGSDRLAVISFGTCSFDSDYLQRIVGILRGMGLKVVVVNLPAGAGADRLAGDPGIRVCGFVRLRRALENADLLISHGGQMSVFEAIAAEVPVAVLPFQPEQAHNGVCLSRIGCGALLVEPTLFMGKPGVYVKRFLETDQKTVAAALESLLEGSAAALERHAGYLAALPGPAGLLEDL